MIDSKLQIIETIQEYLKEMDTKKSAYVKKESYFTRPSKKLSFLKVILLILNLPKRSLAIELSDFFESLDESDHICTASAFSQARYKIKWELFSDLAKFSSDVFYANKEIKTWNGYRLEGVDGTSLNLVKTEELQSYFGLQTNGRCDYVQARVVARYDLLNQIITNAQIGSMKQGEKYYALAQLPEVAEDVISIYDRKFPSFEFMYEHIHRGLKFIMRSKLSFNNVVKQFVKSGKQSAILSFNATPQGIKNLKAKGYDVNESTKIKVRIERIELDNGKVEILLTNLYDSTITNADFKILYNYRWGCETNYDCLKNKFEIELFTGQKPESVLQDFYATIFIHNLNSILIEDCQEEVSQVNAQREHDYKVNRNVSIGIMKSKINKLLFAADSEELVKILDFLKQRFLANLQPIRPGRQFPRKRNRTGGRNKIRPLKNYKRAS